MSTNTNMEALIEVLPSLCEDREACHERPFVAAWVVGDNVMVIQAATEEERKILIATHHTPPLDGEDPALAELTLEWVRSQLGDHHAALLDDWIKQATS